MEPDLTVANLPQECKNHIQRKYDPCVQEPYHKYDETKWDPELQEPYQKISRQTMGRQNARTIAKHMTTQKWDPRVQELYQNK